MLGAWTVWPPGGGEGGMGSRDHREQGWEGCLWGLEGTGVGGPRERRGCGHKEQRGSWGALASGKHEVTIPTLTQSHPQDLDWLQGGAEGDLTLLLPPAHSSGWGRDGRSPSGRLWDQGQVE